MLLSKILNGLDYNAKNFKDVEIVSVETDSRLVKDGSIFVAADGKTNRGVDFIDGAVEKGAVAVVVDKKYNYENDKLIVIDVESPFDFASAMLKNFYENNFPKHLMSITGTKGKTSTAEFIRQILEQLDVKVASIGTLGINYKGKPEEIKTDFLTTRELVEFYYDLNFLKTKQNIDYVVFETTSQGLDTGRTAGLFPEIVGFTNFSQDHLNYHKTMEEYFKCKMKLFREHTTSDTKVVLNADIAEFETIKDICKESGCDKHIISYGKNGDVKLILITSNIDSQDVTFEFKGKEYKFKTPLMGEFQAMNLLCAFSYVYSLNVVDDVKKIVDVLGNISAAEGRMNLAGITKNGASIYVDFAHTANSLECILKTTRDHLNKIGDGRLVILFGLGGQKDQSKRPIMGKIAQDMADIVVITNDNFRNEDPKKIRDEIVAGCDRPNDPNLHNFDGTRKEAIEFAISLLQKNDILILAGKGHEKYAEENGQKLPFDEFKIVQEILKKWKNEKKWWIFSKK